MTRIVRRAVVVSAVATLGAGLAVVFTSGARAIVLDVYLLVVGAVVLLALLRTARALAPRRPQSSFDRALAQMRAGPPQPVFPPLERDIELSRLNTLHHYVRMRPVLRDIAAYRLRFHYGVELDREPERARELIPSRAWEVVRPDCPPPEDRLAPGPSVAAQAAVLDDLVRV